MNSCIKTRNSGIRTEEAPTIPENSKKPRDPIRTTKKSKPKLPPLLETTEKNGGDCSKDYIKISAGV